MYFKANTKQLICISVYTLIYIMIELQTYLNIHTYML